MSVLLQTLLHKISKIDATMKNRTIFRFFILGSWLLTMTVFGQNITTVGLGYNFTYATDITQDLDGNIYVCDATDELIMKIDGANKTTVISAGKGKPGAIALDNDGNLYVAYIAGINSGKIFKMTTNGGNPTLFANPNTSITNLEFLGIYLWYTAPALSNKIGRISLSDGTVGMVNMPYNVANASDFTFDNAGNSYFVFPNYNNVVKIDNIFSTYTISDNSGTSITCVDFRPFLGLVIGGMSDIVIMSVDGHVITHWSLPVYNPGQPFLPMAVEARAQNNASFVFYDTDAKYRVYNFKYPDNTYAVRGSRFDSPKNITLDSGNNIYVSDHDVATGYNSIKKIVPNNAYFGGYQISNIWNTTNTLAGIAYSNNADYIYFGDATDNVIKFVNTSGNTYGNYITNLANPYMMKSYGQIDYYTQRNYSYLVGRKLNFPFGYTYTYLGVLNDAKGFDFDTSGYAYVADYASNVIVKINLSTGASIALGNIGNNFNQPSSVAVDNVHNVMYIADTGNNAIKRMDMNGNNITTIGSGFFKPEGVYLNSSANKLYVADTGNNVVKIIDLIDPNLSVSEMPETTNLQIFPNPASDFVQISSKEKIKTLALFDLSGKQVMNDSNPRNKISLERYPKGMYLLKITFEDGNIEIRKIVKK